MDFTKCIKIKFLFDFDKIIRQKHCFWLICGAYHAAQDHCPVLEAIFIMASSKQYLITDLQRIYIHKQ